MGVDGCRESTTSFVRLSLRYTTLSVNRVTVETTVLRQSCRILYEVPDGWSNCGPNRFQFWESLNWRTTSDVVVFTRVFFSVWRGCLLFHAGWSSEFWNLRGLGNWRYSESAEKTSCPCFYLTEKLENLYYNSSQNICGMGAYTCKHTEYPT